MNAFVACSSTTSSFATRASSACSTAPRRATAGCVKMGVDPMWKTELTGGFPGGEAFYKKWIEEGTTGDVPALDDESQPSAGPAVAEKEEKVVSRGQQIGVDPTWKTEFAGGFPGGEFFYKKWVAEGASGKVPNLQDDLQPGYVGAESSEDSEDGDAGEDSAASAGGTKSAGGNKSAGGASKSGIPTGSSSYEDAGILDMSVDAPAESLYSSYLVGKFQNVAPEISIKYNGDEFDRVGLAMTEVEGGFWQLYYPKSRLNKAPVINIDYRPGAVATASVSMTMDEVSGPPALPNVVPKKGDVVTSLVTDPTTGRPKLVFTVDGEKVI